MKSDDRTSRGSDAQGTKSVPERPEALENEARSGRAWPWRHQLVPRVSRPCLPRIRAQR